MAIQDHLEVTLTLTSINRDIKETVLSTGYQGDSHHLSWAPQGGQESIMFPFGPAPARKPPSNGPSLDIRLY